MKKFTLITAAIAGLALASAQAAKQEGKPAKGEHRPMMEQLLPPPLVEKLNLTADQKAKYDELSAAFKSDAEKWRAEHPVTEADKEAMQKARESGDKEAMKKFMEARKPLMEKRKAYIDQFTATLNEEQKKIMDDAKKNMMHHHGEKHGDKAKPAPAPEQ